MWMQEERTTAGVTVFADLSISTALKCVCICRADEEVSMRIDNADEDDDPSN